MAVGGGGGGGGQHAPRKKKKKWRVAHVEKEKQSG